MSIEYCHYCDVHIDTDFDAEHFNPLVTTECKCLLEEEEELKALKGGN